MNALRRSFKSTYSKNACLTDCLQARPGPPARAMHLTAGPARDPHHGARTTGTHHGTPAWALTVPQPRPYDDDDDDDGDDDGGDGNPHLILVSD